MKRVIGLVGGIGAGKGVITDYLVEEYHASSYRFSDVLKSILEALVLEDTRENLQALGVALRNAFGDNVLVGAIRKSIEEDNCRIVVVDGVRYPAEAEMVKSFFGGILVYVDAPPEVRHKRCLLRGTRGEHGISFEEFMENDCKKTEKNIRELGANADFVLQNDGTIEELHEKVDGIVGGGGQHGKP